MYSRYIEASNMHLDYYTLSLTGLFVRSRQYWIGSTPINAPTVQGESLDFIFLHFDTITCKGSGVVITVRIRYKHVGLISQLD